MSKNKSKDFIDRKGQVKSVSVGTKVRYVPGHAHGDRNHPDCEIGIVTFWNDNNIFVLYEKQLSGADAQCTTPGDLEIY